MAMPPIMKGIRVIPMKRLPTAPLSKPAQGPARMPQRKIASWKKWIDAVNGPSGRGMARGGRDITFAKAAIKATNAMVFALILPISKQCYVLKFL